MHACRSTLEDPTTTTADDYHGQEYDRYLAALCARIAKPGIEVRFTRDFMSPEQLVDWCADNDLNCFMYTRRQPGLSATTDQAIISGRPLLTSSNDTFRHIHQYIPPYPVVSLREALRITPPAVRRLQQDWSRHAFRQTFERMLGAFGVLPHVPDAAEAAPPVPQERPVVLVASRTRPEPDDIVWYPTRLADALGRTSKYVVARVQYVDMIDLKRAVAAQRPHAVILLEPREAPARLAPLLEGVAGPRLLVVEDEERAAQAARAGLLPLQRQPVVPYFTSSAPLRQGVLGVWLFGFSAPASNLEAVIDRLARDLDQVEILIECPEAQRPAFDQRVAAMRERRGWPPRVLFGIHSPPLNCAGIMVNTPVNNLAIFYNDPQRTQELEGAACIAMATERAVAYTRSAPFPGFGAGTHVEDANVGDIIRMGMGAQIRLCAEFSEGRLYAELDRALSGAPTDQAPPTEAAVLAAA